MWNDVFTVHVNKFKSVGATVTSTIAYDTATGKMRIARTHEPILVPDYKFMKLYWATCFIHNLESQVIDYIADSCPYWMLTIHDAILCLPGSAGKTRGAYAVRLKVLHTKRKSVLADYRASIGATSQKANIDFMRLSKMVQEVPEDVEFKATAMK